MKQTSLQDTSLIVTQDVEGAPVRIGQPVRITRAPEDDALSRRLVGCTGVVVALVFDDPRLQYPWDPLIQVRVPGLGEDLFFPEELALAPERLSRQRAEGRQVAAAEAREPVELP